MIESLQSVWQAHLFLLLLFFVVSRPTTKQNRTTHKKYGTPFAAAASVITSFSFTLHEERWLAVAAFCAAALKPLAVLRACWTQKAYEEAGAAVLIERQLDDVGKRFEPAKFTEILRSARFRNYHVMVVKLKSIPGKLMAWFDRCPCHEMLILSENTVEQRRRALEEDGVPGGICPCCSCRAWEVIDGKLDDVIKGLSSAMEDDLMHTMNMKNADGLTEPLSHQDMVLIITDYRAGMLHLQLGFGIRNAWSTNLPWLLMAIPHPNASRGVHWSKACIEAYERKPEAQHHRKSVLFLKPGTPLRSSIDLFISTGVMPPLLRLNTAPFLLIPLGIA